MIHFLFSCLKGPGEFGVSVWLEQRAQVRSKRAAIANGAYKSRRSVALSAAWARECWCHQLVLRRCQGSLPGGPSDETESVRGAGSVHGRRGHGRRRLQKTLELRSLLRSFEQGARLSIFGLMATSTVTVAPPEPELRSTEPRFELQLLGLECCF